MKVLVAGDTGLAGTAISKKFKSAGAEVIGVNRKIVNLLDLTQTRNFLLQSKPDLVISSAAKVGGILANQNFPVEFLIENVSIQNNLLLASHEASVPRLVFLGSSCIYPKFSQQPIKEEFFLTGALESTNSAFAVAKIAGIELVNAFRRQHKRNWISLMPTSLYGPFDNFHETDAHVIPSLIRKFHAAVATGARQVTLWGTGTPRREFLHVDDFAAAVFVCATSNYNDSMHINVGTGKDVSIQELSELIARLSGFVGEILWDSTFPDGTPRKVLDIGKVTNLGWSPKVTLEQGISETIAWYTENLRSGSIRI